MHPRVEISDGSHTLVPEGGHEGADGDVHYVAVEQDLDQRSEGPKANLANEGKPRFIVNLCVYFKLLNLSVIIYVHLHSGVELKP
jgi:hypothetical protein